MSRVTDKRFWVNGCLYLLIPAWFVLAGPRIPSGSENQESAKLFLKELYPDRATSFSKYSGSTAPVAVVFHVIRSCNETTARQAIDFAADSQFGYASPYVIERLESPNRELRESARAFLVRLAGKDYGATADAWRAWWLNPPRTVLGVVSVGQTTLWFASPLIVGMAGFLFWGIQRLWTGEPALSGAVGHVLVAAWFTAFGVVAFPFVKSTETCTFGSETITYRVDHAVVVGLEDVRAGDGGLFLILMAIFLLGPLGLGWISLFFPHFFRRGTQRATDEGKWPSS
ncbi:MAG TPA: hypothetical protein VJ783_21810 [Pirellulales bacterium]|nr:hypothetical protein [Pirellulales bacterium]